MHRVAGVLLVCGGVCLLTGLSLQGAVRHAILIGWCAGLAFTFAAAVVAVRGWLRG